MESLLLALLTILSHTL